MATVTDVDNLVAALRLLCDRHDQLKAIESPETSPQVSVIFNDVEYPFTEIEETIEGSGWTEYRGWASQENGLYFVVRVAGDNIQATLIHRYDTYQAYNSSTSESQAFWGGHKFRGLKLNGNSIVPADEILMGGMGVTIEEGTAPVPSRVLPLFVDPCDISTKQSSYGDTVDALLANFMALYEADLARWGSARPWKDKGDYKTSNDYVSGEYLKENWANGQYDIATGLLAAWFRLGTDELWRHAEAACRHCRDIDTVKYYPFSSKYNGGGYRKGDFKDYTSHFGTEPVTAYACAFRPLPIYSALVGDQYSMDVARMSVEYHKRMWDINQAWCVGVGDRDAAWQLRAFCAGNTHFSGQGVDFDGLANSLVDGLLAHNDPTGKTGRLPGNQPIWKGQIVEALIIYNRLADRQDVKDAIVAEVDFWLSTAIRNTSGTYEFLYQWGDDIYEQIPDQHWSSDFNYGFLWLNSLAYAYSLTGNQTYKTWADDLFDYCSVKLQNNPWTRNWTSFLGFHGLFVELM